MANFKAPWMGAWGWPRVTVTLALTFLAAVVVLHGLAYWMLVDDAFIAFRYADNLSHGLGLVFNEGERVEGYTDFLWVVLLAGVGVLGASIPVASQVLGAAFAALVVPVSYWAGRRCFELPSGVALLPGVVVAASAATAMWTGAGLETALYMTLFTAALALALQDLAGDPRVPVSGLLFGLAALTRPEATGLFGVLGVGAVVLGWGRIRTLFRMASGFALVFVPHLVFRLAYYGYPFPNTFYAKTSMAPTMWVKGLDYLGGFLLAHGVWALPFLLGLFLRSGSGERKRSLLALLVLGAAAGYIATVGGDFYPYWRFCVPYLPWLALLVCAGAWRCGRRLAGSHGLGRALAALLVLLVAGSAALSAKAWPDAVYREKVLGALPTARLLASYGRWFRENRPPDTLVAISTIGRVSYHSRLKILDMLGITDAHIAHGPMDLTYGTVGHQRYDSEYVLSRKPDIVALELGQHILGFDPGEVNTEKIHRQIQPGEAWFPAPADLIGRRAFRLDYAPRVAEVEPNRYFIFFERDPALRRTIARIPLDSPDPGAHFALGMRLRKHGLLDEAVTRMRRAASLDERKSLSPALNAAYFLVEAGRTAEALVEFQTLRARAPDEPQVGYGVALTLHQLGRYREAIPEWKRYLAITRSPRFAEKARTMLAEAEKRAARD